MVRSYAVERGEALVLIDPMSPPAELTAGRALQVALTCPWHTRSAAALAVPVAEVDSRPGFYPGERVLWLEEHRALVFGDSYPGGPIPDEWFPEGQTREGYQAWFTSLLELPVNLLLPTHGDPGSRERTSRAAI